MCGESRQGYLWAGPPGADDHVVGDADVDGVMQAEADDTVVVRVERPGRVFAQHRAEGIDERLPEAGPVPAWPGRQRDCQPGRAWIDGGRLHCQLIVEESVTGMVRPRGGPHHRCHPIRCGALRLLQVIHIALPSAMRRAIRWAFNRFVYRADGRDEAQPRTGAGPGERAEVKDSPRRVQGGPHVRHVKNHDRREGRWRRRGLWSGSHRGPCVLLAARPRILGPCMGHRRSHPVAGLRYLSPARPYRHLSSPRQITPGGLLLPRAWRAPKAHLAVAAAAPTWGYRGR